MVSHKTTLKKIYLNEFKRVLKQLTENVHFIVATATYIALFSIFFAAYFSPSKSVYVLIDTLGEANIEAAIFLFSAPFVLYKIYTFYKNTPPNVSPS